jgi:hypothetical protein
MRRADWKLHQKCFIGLMFFVCFVASAAEATRITAEKNCSVRIDGNYDPGEKLFVLRDSNGRRKKIAIVQVSRVKGNSSYGKVIRGPMDCQRLKGLSVESARKDVSPGGRNRYDLSVLESSAFAGYLGFQGVGLHQNTNSDQKNTSMSLYALNFNAEFWPGEWISKNQDILAFFGASLRYQYGLAIPDIQVDPPAEAKNATSGAQQTTPTTLIVSLAARYPLLNGKSVSEFHVGYISHQLTHQLTSRGGLLRVPLRDVSVSGFAVGLKQKYWVYNNFRAQLGLTFPIGLTGLADNTSERTKDRTAVFDGETKGNSGLLVDASIESILGMFKGSVGVNYEAWSGQVTLLEGPNHSFEESYLFFYLGAGVYL